MQTLGQKINQVRKMAGMSSAGLANAIGISSSSMSYIERDFYKDGPSAETVVRISDVLKDKSILLNYLENNPVYQSIVYKEMPDLNGIRHNPANTLIKFAIEADKSAQAARALSHLFMESESIEVTKFDEVLRENLKHIVDIQNRSEILFLQLVIAGVRVDENRSKSHAYLKDNRFDPKHHGLEKGRDDG